MCRYKLLKALSILGIVAIILLAMQYHKVDAAKVIALTVVPITELEKEKASLEDTVAELRSELADKKNELAGLDQKLGELEIQYNKLLEERRKIAERLEALKGAQ